jgi:hypothetical protein
MLQNKLFEGKLIEADGGRNRCYFGQSEKKAGAGIYKTQVSRYKIEDSRFKKVKFLNTRRKLLTRVFS